MADRVDEGSVHGGIEALQRHHATENKKIPWTPALNDEALKDARKAYKEVEEKLREDRAAKMTDTEKLNAIRALLDEHSDSRGISYWEWIDAGLGGDLGDKLRAILDEPKPFPVGTIVLGGGARGEGSKYTEPIVYVRNSVGWSISYPEGDVDTYHWDAGDRVIRRMLDEGRGTVLK